MSLLLAYSRSGKLLALVMLLSCNSPLISRAWMGVVVQQRQEGQRFPTPGLWEWDGGDVDMLLGNRS